MTEQTEGQIVIEASAAEIMDVLTDFETYPEWADVKTASVLERGEGGVGTRVALSVLSTLKPGDLASAVAMRDKGMVARAPGVGPKVAERIVTELKDKAPAYTSVDPAVVRLSGAPDEKRAPQPVADAVSALVNLGYGEPQALAAIAAATRSAGEGAETAQLIRLGLKELAK